MTPETRISADDGLDVVLVDGRVLLTDSVPVRAILVSTDDRMLVRKGYPVVRDQGREQKGVCPSALRTPDTTDPKRTDTIRKKDAPCIVSVDGQTGGMPAGASQPVEREIVYDGIVIILRKLIVITDRNEYHSLVRHSLMAVTGDGTADELSQGGSAVLFKKQRY